MCRNTSLKKAMDAQQGLKTAEEEVVRVGHEVWSAGAGRIKSTKDQWNVKSELETFLYFVKVISPHPIHVHIHNQLHRPKVLWNFVMSADLHVELNSYCTQTSLYVTWITAAPYLLSSELEHEWCRYACWASELHGYTTTNTQVYPISTSSYNSQSFHFKSTLSDYTTYSACAAQTVIHYIHSHRQSIWQLPMYRNLSRFKGITDGSSFPAWFYSESTSKKYEHEQKS